MKPGVTVVIPTIPPRSRLLARALMSVAAQTRPVEAIAIAQDVDHDGAWATRNAGLRMVNTEWIAFLDDDDELLPHHVERLLGLAADTGAGLVWGWFDVIGGIDPFPQHRGRTFDPDVPHIVPITYLARTELVLDAVAATGGFLPDETAAGMWEIQDAPLFCHVARAGGTACIDEVTWLWHHHGANTSGLPSRWRTPQPVGGGR